jgi:hypothetical protein
MLREASSWPAFDALEDDLLGQGDHSRARGLIVGASKHGSFFSPLEASLHSYDAAVDWQIDARDVAAFVRR